MSDLTIRITPELFAPAESSRYEGSWDLPVFKSGPDLYSFASPLAWQVDVSNVGDALLVSGSVEGEAATGCARCLEPVPVPVLGEVEGYFLLSDAHAPEEMEADEFDVLPDTNEIDLEPLLQQALLLDIPLLPLCRDDCKGLCQVCGANLNEESCDCSVSAESDSLPSDDGKPNPFAVLLDMEFDNE